MNECLVNNGGCHKMAECTKIGRNRVRKQFAKVVSFHETHCRYHRKTRNSKVPVSDRGGRPSEKSRQSDQNQWIFMFTELRRQTNEQTKTELIKGTQYHRINQTRSGGLLFLPHVSSRKNADAWRASKGRGIIVNQSTSATRYVFPSLHSPPSSPLPPNRDGTGMWFREFWIVSSCYSAVRFRAFLWTQLGWFDAGCTCRIWSAVCVLQDNGGCSKYARCEYLGDGQRNCTCRNGHIGDGLECRGSTYEVSHVTWPLTISWPLTSNFAASPPSSTTDVRPRSLCVAGNESTAGEQFIQQDVLSESCWNRCFFLFLKKSTRKKGQLINLDVCFFVFCCVSIVTTTKEMEERICLLMPDKTIVVTSASPCRLTSSVFFFPSKVYYSNKWEHACYFYEVQKWSFLTTEKMLWPI